MLQLLLQRLDELVIEATTLTDTSIAGNELVLLLMVHQVNSTSVATTVNAATVTGLNAKTTCSFNEQGVLNMYFNLTGTAGELADAYNCC